MWCLLAGQMSTRYCALLLLILTVSPFTAPFSMCEVERPPVQATQKDASPQFKAAESSDKSAVSTAILAPGLSIVVVLSIPVSAPSASLTGPPSGLHTVLRL